MEYKHGIYGSENPSPTLKANKSSTVQVVIGTAPVNLIESVPVNEPIEVNSLNEAKGIFGYSEEFDNYTLCASMELNFSVFNIAPLVFINILDKTKHKSDVMGIVLDVEDKAVISNVTGILKESVAVKNEAGDTTYTKDTDYSLSFTEEGKLKVSILDSGAASSEVKLTLDYSVLDTSKITDDDVIGGYDATTNKYTGAHVIRQVYPKLALVPGIIIAPGYTQKSAVARKLEELSRNIHDCFNGLLLCDVDPSIKDHTKVADWKNDNGYNQQSILLWPKKKISGIIYWFSQVAAAAIQHLDFGSENVPYKSPSNKKIPIEAAVLNDGTELFLEKEQANILNAAGVVTSINMSGWRMWGNETCVYPEKDDPKDRYIMTRRMFDFINNQFILRFLDKVDDPTDKRLIEAIVDGFNMYLNSLQSQGMIMSGKIEFDYSTATPENLASGKLQFITKLGSHVPAKEIIHVTEFDPKGLISIGGE